MFERKIVPIHYKTLVKIFELDGFIVKRKKGDHIIKKKEQKKPLFLKSSPKQVPVTHIRTNIKTAGIRVRFAPSPLNF